MIPIRARPQTRRSVFCPQVPAPAGDAVDGKRLFVKDGCYECRSYVGQRTKNGARPKTVKDVTLLDQLK
jgi:hypothetical protein